MTPDDARVAMLRRQLRGLWDMAVNSAGQGYTRADEDREIDNVLRLIKAERPS